MILSRHNLKSLRPNKPRSKLDIDFGASEIYIHNKLPCDMKDSDNINISRRRLKTFLFRDCYGVDEKCIGDNYIGPDYKLLEKYKGGPE